MNISQHISTAKTDAQQSKIDARQKIQLERAVHEFESVFVSYMLKSMRNTIEKADNSTDGFSTDGGFGGEMLESLFDAELAKHVSRNSNLGLAEMLYRKMTGEDLPKATKHGSFARSSLARDTVRQHDVPKSSSEKKVRLPMKEQSTTVTVAGERTVFQLPVSLSPKVAERDDIRVEQAGVAGVQPKVPKWLTDRLNSYASHIAEASNKHGVSENLIRAVIAAESGGRPMAQSGKDAKGLMQLIDSTAAAMGVKNVWNPRENILGGAKYLKQLIERFGGDEKLALAGYNAGPANVVKHDGIPPFKETQQYVARVMSFMKLFEAQGGEDE